MKKVNLLFAFLCIVHFANAQWAFNGNDIYNTNTGNVGVGTQTPQAKLDVTGQALFLSGIHRIYISEFTAFDPLRAGIRNNSGHLVINAKDSGILYLNRDVNAETRIQSTVGANTIDIAVFKSNGTVGIGTANPGSFKLAVEGKIGAREVRVTNANPWPDYVFNNNYQLKTLYSLETYIRQNNHLPNIPSAQEVKDNGIELGNMNGKLLEKIEELTLYIIELNKKIDKLEKRGTTQE
jgi:hypothetical protein